MPPNSKIMKQILTLLLTFSFLISFSQGTINFADPEATWNVAKTITNGNPLDPGFVETTTTVYGFNGDTIINNDIWLKIYQTNDSSFMNNLLFIGLIKEEDGIVYFNDTLNNIDTLYNFNLQVGDSVLYNFYGMVSEYLEIINIDSIEINNSFHKRYYIEESSLEPFYLEEVWIEGIGSIHGPLFTKYPVVFSNESIADSLFVTCYKSDNNIIWNNPNYDSCFVHIVMSINKEQNNQLILFPNPVNDILKIELQENNYKIARISVYNILGSLKSEKTFENIDPILIDVTRLLSGIYILQIEIDNKNYIKKIIKE